MRCLRSDSQRAGTAAATGALAGTAKVDESRRGAHVAWRKGMDSLNRRGFIRGQDISWKNVYGFILEMVITHSISAAYIGAYFTSFIKTQYEKQNTSLCNT